MEEKDLARVLTNYPIGRANAISRITSGLIHATYRVEADSGKYILQALGKVFSEASVRDTERVTAHLKGKGITAQQIVHVSSGTPFYRDAEGRLWRLMTFIDGVTYQHHLPQDSYAAEAGKVLAEFHVAMEDFDANQLESQPIVHQTEQFYKNFIAAYGKLMQEEPNEEQRNCYRYIYETLPSLMLPANLPTTTIHGDPKISNFIFRDGKAICMIDLDTCMRHTPLVDIGDLLRWCGISEEAFPNYASLPQFAAYMKGYARVKPLTPEMKGYVLQALRMVALGLASRFATDVISDDYFGWDDAKYASRKEHNKARAKSQVSLAEDITRKEREMREILKSL